MNEKMIIAEKNRRLTVAYQKINDEGRNVLDTVIQKLAEINWKPGEKEEQGSECKNCNTEGEKLFSPTSSNSAMS
jgi:hypothetical protein